MTDIKHATTTELIREDNMIINEKYVTAYYSKSLKVVGVVWDGIFTKEQYINLFDQLLDFGRKNEVIGFYSDIRKQGVVSVEARKYFEKNVSPEAQRLGINKTGVVSDASPFKKYYLNTIIKMTGRPAKICSDPEEALNYIIS